MNGELIENRIVVWNIQDSQNLFAQGYYGKPLGIAKPKPGQIDAPLILDLMEGYYLLLESKIKICQGKRKVTEEKMQSICKAEYHDFDKKFIVYKKFRDDGYIVGAGIKFGCDFAVYQKGPGIDHAPFLVQVYNKGDTITSTGVVLAGRLATSVRKHFIIAIPRSKKNVDYLALDWWKA